MGVLEVALYRRTQAPEFARYVDSLMWFAHTHVESVNMYSKYILAWEEKERADIKWRVKLSTYILIAFDESLNVSNPRHEELNIALGHWHRLYFSPKVALNDMKHS